MASATNRMVYAIMTWRQTLGAIFGVLFVLALIARHIPESEEQKAQHAADDARSAYLESGWKAHNLSHAECLEFFGLTEEYDSTAKYPYCSNGGRERKIGPAPQPVYIVPRP